MVVSVYIFNWKIMIVYIYGVQCDIIMYVYIVERFSKANEQICYLTNLFSYCENVKNQVFHEF